MTDRLNRRRGSAIVATVERGDAMVSGPGYANSSFAKLASSIFVPDELNFTVTL